MLRSHKGSALLTTALGLIIALGSIVLAPPRVQAQDKTPEAQIAEEIDQAFEKLVLKKKKKLLGMYHFQRAVNLWRAARVALGIDVPPGAKAGDAGKPNEEAGTILLNEAHEQLQLLFRRNKKKLKDDKDDKRRDKSAEKQEKKIRFTVLDEYLEPIEELTPEPADYYEAKEGWRSVVGTAAAPDEETSD